MSNAGKNSHKFFLSVLFLFSFCLPAYAVSDDIVAAMAGEWLIAPEDGAQGCVLQFDKDKTIGGYAVQEKAHCALADLHDRVASWDFGGDGDIVLRDATRKTILHLYEQEGGPYRTQQGTLSAMIMVKGQKGVDRVPMAQHLFGTWQLNDKGGKPLCKITLLDHPPEGGEESYALELVKGCSGTLRKYKLVSWRIQDFSLELDGSDGESIILVPQADGSFVADDKVFSLKR
ncbi:MAG: AprI/Inh family metalloprotease inhibitor [Pseudomonadota bacterium]